MSTKTYLLLWTYLFLYISYLLKYYLESSMICPSSAHGCYDYIYYRPSSHSHAYAVIHQSWHNPNLVLIFGQDLNTGLLLVFCSLLYGHTTPYRVLHLFWSIQSMNE